MGAFLGNLQVWGAAREEVAALLPRALVGQWSEHFVTVLAEIPDHRSYMDAAIDGADRFWIQIGNSTVEAYNRELRLLSRHRLKGEIMAWYLDDHGRLCVVTYSECKGKHDIRFDGAGDFYYPNFDPEKEIVRVYRLS